MRFFSGKRVRMRSASHVLTWEDFAGALPTGTVIGPDPDWEGYWRVRLDKPAQYDNGAPEHGVDTPVLLYEIREAADNMDIERMPERRSSYIVTRLSNSSTPAPGLRKEYALVPEMSENEVTQAALPRMNERYPLPLSTANSGEPRRLMVLRVKSEALIAVLRALDGTRRIRCAKPLPDDAIVVGTIQRIGAYANEIGIVLESETYEVCYDGMVLPWFAIELQEY